MTEQGKEFIRNQLKKLIKKTWNFDIDFEESTIICIDTKKAEPVPYSDLQGCKVKEVSITMNKFIFENEDIPKRKIGFYHDKYRSVLALDKETYDEII